MVSGLLAMTFIMLLYTLVIPGALMIDGAVDWETVGGLLTVGSWIGAMLGLGLGTGLRSAGATYLATIVLLRIRRRPPAINAFP
ncbi:MAG TPA: hypothetical protein VFV01_13775 [Spirillospora sp.]|nr:hypothetical protein [Spirillospora sp.]